MKTLIALGVITAFLTLPYLIPKSEAEPACKPASVDVNNYWNPLYQFQRTDFRGNESRTMYYIRGREQWFVTRTDLNDAKNLADLIDKYPCNWIDGYESVSFIYQTNEGEKTIQLVDDNISDEVRESLKKARMSTPIVVSVKYLNRNAVTEELDERTMNVTLTLVPEKIAVHPEGKKAFLDYLDLGSRREVAALGLSMADRIVVFFDVNAEGMCCNVKFENSSGEEEVDDLIRKLIEESPRWEPAENSKGEYIVQTFELNIGVPGC